VRGVASSRKGIQISKKRQKIVRNRMKFERCSGGGGPIGGNADGGSFADSRKKPHAQKRRGGKKVVDGGRLGRA